MVVPTNSKEAAFTSWDRLVLGQKVRRCVRVVRVAIVEKEDNECSRREARPRVQYKYTPFIASAIASVMEPRRLPVRQWRIFGALRLVHVARNRNSPGVQALTVNAGGLQN